MVKTRKILITGGGSGGHLSACSAIIEGIKGRYPELYTDLVYVGGDLGMVGEDFGNSLEQRKFENADFKTEYIRAGKLQRRLSLSSLRLFLRSFLGLVDSFKIIKREKPDLIFSTGGFVSVPVTLAGWLKGTPIYLHEQTATVGLSNKVVSKFAKRIYIAFESSKDHFQEEKVLLVGNIVREAITNFNTEEVSKNVKNLITQDTEYPLIYISGGGLGSHMINEKVLSEIKELLTKYRIILQTGSNQKCNDFNNSLEIKSKLPQELQERFLPIKFIDDKNIGYVYKNMGLFIGRAGANTVYEIGLLAKPSIFIPIPWVTNNEQFLNAKVLVDLGLSTIIEEKELKKLTLNEIIEVEISKLSKKKINVEEIKRMFPANAVEKVLNDMYT